MELEEFYSILFSCIRYRLADRKQYFEEMIEWNAKIIIGKADRFVHLIKILFGGLLLKEYRTK